MFTTIVVASDGSETGDRAVEAAHALARDDRSRVVLAHVNELMAGRGGIARIHPNEDQIQLKMRFFRPVS